MFYLFNYFLKKIMSQKKINNKSTIQRLIKNYILSHKSNIFFALIMMIISAGTTGLHAWLLDQP